MVHHTPNSMNFDTAIYYDIENLIGGYGASLDTLKRFGLRSIFEDITRSKYVGKIAIQRAYANWSDSRLNHLRQELIELGIEPIQMIGFSRGPNQNASDIHLAIDVIECALTRGFVQRFVIVSGDGGFACLAKKLHEYNRVVIGCAYEKSSNPVLAGLCDDFICLKPLPVPKPVMSISEAAPKPATLAKAKSAVKAPEAAVKMPIKSTESNATSSPDSSTTAKSKGAPSVPVKIKDPVLKQLYGALSLETLQQTQDVGERVRMIFKKLLSLSDVKKIMNEKGVPLTTISSAFSLFIPGFNPLTCGFVRLLDLVRHLLHECKYRLVLVRPNQYLVVNQSVKLANAQRVETLANAPKIHEPNGYRQILAKGTPSIKLHSSGDIPKIIRSIHQSGLLGKSLSKTELLGQIMAASGSQEVECKSALFLLSCAGFLYRDHTMGSDDEPWQLISRDSEEVMLSKFHEIAREKILKCLGRCDQGILKEVFGSEVAAPNP